MNFTPLVYNSSSCHSRERYGENCLRKCFGLISCWMNESWNKPCYPMITFPVLSKSLADRAPQLRLEELNDALWHQQSCKAARPSGRWRDCDGFNASPLSYLHVWQQGTSHSLLKWVTGREWPLYAEDFKLPPEEAVVSVSVFWLLVRWQDLGGMRSDQLWLSCVMILQWVPADW